MYSARDLSIDTNLKRKDLATDCTALASFTVNIKVPQIVIKILHLLACQFKALRLLSARVQGEDDRASFANSSRSVDVREISGSLEQRIMVLCFLSIIFFRDWRVHL